MGSFDERMERIAARKAELEARKQQRNAEAVEAVRSFVELMVARGIGPMAVYRQTAHKIVEEKGWVRRRQIDTGRISYEHHLVGRGWPTQTGNGSDWRSNMRLYTVMEDQQVYWTHYPVHEPEPGMPRPPYVIVDRGPFSAEYMAHHIDALAYTATAYIEGRGRL